MTMTFTYKKLKNPVDNKVETNLILRKEDNVFIPFDEANTDYQEYLEWVSKGNTPEEAD
tara:strand:+ start:309 stop:485 length:177 start_codon:yes stop_codon:yes gene_type:complete